MSANDEINQIIMAVESDDDYSETKAKRKAVGNALATLIGYLNRDVKNRELGSLASAREYITRHPKYGLRVEAEDLDQDKDTPDNTVIYRKNGNIYAVDGFFTAPGFGEKNKKTEQRILKSRDTLQGYYGTGNYATRLTNKGKNKKIAVDNSLLSPYQRQQGFVKGKITEDIRWIPSDKMPSEFNYFKKLVGQNMETIRPESSKTISLVTKLAAQLWNEILLQVTRQFFPQGARIQEYRNDHPDTQAQLDDLIIAKRIFNTKRKGQRLYAAAYQLISNIQGNIKQIKIGIIKVQELIRLFDPSTIMPINEKELRSKLSQILTQIKYFGKRNYEQAIDLAIIEYIEKQLAEEEQRIKYQREQMKDKMRQLIKKKFPQQEQRHEHQLEHIYEIHNRWALEDFHNTPDLNLNQMFKTNEEEIDEIHQKYINQPFHQTQESKVIILCDTADEVKFNVIKNKALQRYDESTSTLTFSVNNNIDTREKITKPYYRNLANLNQIDTFLDQIYRYEQRSAFKIRADFGTIIETSEYDGNEQKISNQYILPVDANTERRVPLIIKSQENIENYKHCMRDVIANIQERTQEDTHQKLVAVFSIMIRIYKFSLAGAAIPLLQKHIKRREVYYVECKQNLCFFTAYSFITMPNSKEKRWKDCSRIAKGKRIFKRIYGKEFDDLYKGFKFATDIDEFIEKEQINVHMFTYGGKDQSPSYYAIPHYKCDTSD
ncbi:MAG: hypothetical protein EZS28_015460 [Streblomastix strix]|uniref:Uncharacterized protein n=1 Tax=Streblomastix strix TaxID=222440 RepID=A0A5J4W272_9EUKA|nr:MAG: hypothetical protein EZS28_015460 [Streblomastix strix]